jgi:PAS domain S-box-containing protein
MIDKPKEERVEEIKLLQERIKELEKLYAGLKEEHRHTKRFETVVRDSNDSIIIQDIDGRITAWNRGAQLMYGYTESEALGMGIEHLTPKGKVPEHKELGRRLIAGEAVPSFETQRITKDGRILDVWLTVTKVIEKPSDSVISTGRDLTNLVGIALIERNISERKMAEMQYKTVTQSSADGFWQTDTQANIVDVNDACCRILKYSREELLKMKVSDIEDKENPQDIKNHIHKVKTSGSDRFETRHKRKDGIIIDVEVCLTYLEGFDRMFVFTRDISERKQIENTLRESEAFLSTIIENIPDMVFVKKAKDLTFVKFNKAGEELLGFSRESMIGKSDRDFFSKDQADFFIAEDRSVFKGKRVREIPAEKIQTKDKGERILHTKKIPLLDDQGKPAYLLGISEDITERKQAEAQIIQSEKMAGIGRLAASMTHELRNPLMYITANISLMEQYFQRIAGEVVELEKITQIVPPESQEKLAVLKDSFLKTYKEIEQSVKDSREGCARINDIVGGLLDYARIGSDLTEPVDLSVVIEKALELVGSDIRYKCKVEKDFQKVPMVSGNQRELEQVFVNLFVNASQAIKKDGLLKVKSYLDGREAVVEVSDNGAGIAPENLNKIFEPFFTTKKEGEGAGLGLAIVHKIIERHGGSISVASEVDKGATFIIRLPVKPNYT